MVDHDMWDFAHLLEPDPVEPAPPVSVIGKGRVTVLHSLRGIATKRFTPTRIYGYSKMKYFNCVERAANNVHDLANILQDIQTNVRALVIRGTPVGPQRNHVLRRSIGESATFRDDPCHWLCLDIDSCEAVDILTTPPAAEIRELVESAPQLRGTTCVVQISSRWGIKPGIRAHLWYWLEEPRTSQQVSEWASGLPFRVDHALFNPVQPHYTADPIFDGVADPLHGTPRVFLLEGMVSDALYVPLGTAGAELDHWVAAIVGLEDDDPRHPLVNRAAYSLGGWVGAGTLDLDETRDAIFTACVESGVFEPARLDAVKREIESGLQDGARRPRQCEDWKAGMIRNKEGAIKPLPDNFLRLFRMHPAMTGVLGYDVRKNSPILIKAPPWTQGKHFPRGLRDSDDVEATGWMNRIGIHSSAISQVSAAISAVAESNPVDLVVEWLNKLPEWDRKPRVFRWLPQVTGCPDTLYTRAAGGRFLISLVARAMRPGCKVDDMLVLVGPQGGLKSTLFRMIVAGPGDWAFSDCLGDIRKPQDYMPTLMGPWLVEVAELSQFNRKEVEAVKKFLSTQSDRFRLSYGRRAVDIPRRGCLAGTSNTSDFLSDPTGNRRFWPVDVKKLDLERFTKQRDQIFAEALVEYNNGQPWYLVGDEVAASIEEQTAHTVVDTWEDRIREYLDEPPILGSHIDGSPAERKDQTSVTEIVRECLQIPAVAAQPAHSRRVGVILKKLGWKQYRLSGRGCRPYVYRREKTDERYEE